MNLQDLGKNRVVMVILVAAMVGGYVFIRESRFRVEKRVEKEKPVYLTEEFAETQLEKASPADRDTARQLLSDAEMYMESRQFREAASAYHRAIALYPDGRVYFAYAQYLFRMNKLTMMEDSLELASAQGFDQARIDYEMARLHGKLDQPFEALQRLRAAVEAGEFGREEIEDEHAFDVIRKSIITKQEYTEFISRFY